MNDPSMTYETPSFLISRARKWFEMGSGLEPSLYLNFKILDQKFPDIISAACGMRIALLLLPVS